MGFAKRPNMLTRLLHSIRLVWEYLSNEYEVRLFIVVWLFWAAVIVPVAAISGYYKDDNTLYGLLSELHGSLFELLLVGIVVAFFLSRRARREWRPTRDMIF